MTARARATDYTPTAFPLSAFRAFRFRHGVTCPRCGSGRVQRWGSFSGRRRFRCVACRRTFSDFTGTALAYVKQLPAWYPYCRCMLEARSVRAAAHLVGISPATAFRWRHRVLAAVDRGDTGRLGLTVTIDETWFQQSEKGSRRLDRPPRRRPIRYRHHATPVWVLVARDETGRTAGDVIGLLRPGPPAVERVLAGRVAPDAELVSRFGSYGAPAVAADRLRIPHRTASLVAPEVTAVGRYIVRLRRWLRPFRGVATRYLAHYLAWHRFVDGVGGREERVVVAMLMAGCPP